MGFCRLRIESHHIKVNVPGAEFPLNETWHIPSPLVPTPATLC
jgi:hypothetical protein